MSEMDDVVDDLLAAEPGAVVRAVVVVSDAHAGAEPADDARQPA